MITLGITHPISMNCAACLLVDGKLIAFAEEERFTRLKHAPHVHPECAIQFCLKKAGITPAQVDVTAIGFCAPQAGAILPEDISRYLQGTLDMGRQFVFNTNLALLARDTQIVSYGQRQYYDHHLCHAASAAIPSGFKETNILTLDGWGGAYSGILGYWSIDGEMQSLRLIPPENSWGMVYELVTLCLGFRPHSGEGKTMGLASYGQPNQVLLPDFCEDELGLPDTERYRDYLLGTLRSQVPPLRHHSKPQQIHQDIAATLQGYYERSLVKIAHYLRDKTGCGKFAVAGGVGLNCTGNGVLGSCDFVEDLFIQPASHDAGTALGAAILAHKEIAGKWPQCAFSHAFFGSSFTNEEILNTLKFARVPFVEANPAEAAALALADNLTVGFFQGAAEVGPRALGHRSILAHPGFAQNQTRINQNVKRRELWRPLAPSVKEECFCEIFPSKMRKSSPFMLMAFQVASAWRERLPAIVHTDGTARPQTVNAQTDPVYHELLSRFERLTGLPVVMNTSFNLDDEPLVNSPEQALATFARSGLDVLVMGPYVVRKNQIFNDGSSSLVRRIKNWLRKL